MQYLNPEISRLQSPDRVLSIVYVLLLEQLLVIKILYFLFLWSEKTPTFQIIYKHPLWRLFLDCRAILWDETSHFTKYLQIQCKTLPKTLHTFQQNSLFFFYGFPSCAHFLFVSSQIFWCKVVFTLTTYILKHKKDVLKETKLPKLYICYKLAIRTPQGLLKVVQIESMWYWFCVCIDNLEQVSQIILLCLFPPLSIICIWNIAFFSALFT